MTKKKVNEVNLTTTTICRFIRTLVPQLMVAIPVITAMLLEHKDSVPFWVLPTIAFIGSVVTALDKLYRELDKQK